MPEYLITERPFEALPMEGEPFLVAWFAFPLASSQVSVAVVKPEASSHRFILDTSVGEKSFFAVADFLAPLCAPGLLAGRIGNFINQELWGRVTEMPWGVVFPMAGPLPRHPSQLYEAGLEGVILFLVVWIYSASPKYSGRVSGVFLLGYSLMRFIVEFFREPDAHLGLIVGDAISMGQILSIPVALFGFWLLIRPVRASRAI